jgi:hypothetical protein
VLRCKDENKRLKIAEAMEKATKNSDIGYDQWQRDTLFNNVKDKGFDPSKTTKKVETDCSALVRVCIAYAYGKDIAGNIRTVTEPSALVKTGEFEKLTSDKYCKSSDWLLRGDIVCTSVSGHTAVVLDDGAKVKKEKPSTSNPTTTNKVVEVDSAKSFSRDYAGAYTTTSNLYLRTGAGKSKKSIMVMKKGTKVNNYGFYTKVDGTVWLLVKCGDKTGFCSKKYLKK